MENIVIILKQHKKLIILFFVLLLAGFSALKFYEYWRAKNYATLIVNASPIDMIMKNGDKEFKSPETLYFKPGEYTLTFSRENFTNDSRTVTLQKGQSTTLNVPLYPTNKAGQDYLDNSLAARQQAEFVGGLRQDELTDEFVSNNPIVRVLPVTRRDFIIDYSSTEGDGGKWDIRVRITYAGKIGKKNAEKWFTDNGYKASDYNVAYIDIEKIPKEDNHRAKKDPYY